MPLRSSLLVFKDIRQEMAHTMSASAEMFTVMQVFAGLITRDHLLVLLRQALSQAHPGMAPPEVPYEALRRNPLADRRRAAALDPLLHILQVCCHPCSACQNCASKMMSMSLRLILHTCKRSSAVFFWHVGQLAALQIKALEDCMHLARCCCSWCMLAHCRWG